MLIVKQAKVASASWFSLNGGLSFDDQLELVFLLNAKHDRFATSDSKPLQNYFCRHCELTASKQSIKAFLSLSLSLCIL